MKRVLVIVLDSLGCGGAEDAAGYGDEGADTLGHLFEREGLELPNLATLGLDEVLPGYPEDAIGSRDRLAAGCRSHRKAELRKGAAFARMGEASTGKDSTTGHWELAG